MVVWRLLPPVLCLALGFGHNNFESSLCRALCPPFQSRSMRGSLRVFLAKISISSCPGVSEVSAPVYFPDFDPPGFVSPHYLRSLRGWGFKWSHFFGGVPRSLGGYGKVGRVCCVSLVRAVLSVRLPSVVFGSGSLCVRRSVPLLGVLRASGPRVCGWSGLPGWSAPCWCGTRLSRLRRHDAKHRGEESPFLKKDPRTTDALWRKTNERRKCLFSEPCLFGSVRERRNNVIWL